MKYLFIFLYLFVSSQISAYNTLLEYNIKLLPISEELPNSTVKRIFQDKNGFMWLATESGLCRYDGYKTENVKLPEYMSSSSYVSNNIQCLAQDSLGRIWAGTQQGLQIVDLHCNLIDLLGENSIQQRRITSLLADGRYMWVGTDNGLYRYDLDRNVFRSYLHRPNMPRSIPSGSITAIYKDKMGKIWIGIWGKGLSWLDVETSESTRMPVIGKNNNPFHIYQDDEGVYWISTWGDGLLKMTFDKQRQEYDYKLFNISALVPEIGSRNVVYNVVEDRYHHLWLITPRGIVRMLDKEQDIFEFIATQLIYPKSSNFLHHIYKDKNGNIWVGATNDGVYFISFDKQIFHYDILESKKKQLGYTIVNDMKYIKGNLWLGLTNGGVQVVDPKHNFKPLYTTTQLPSTAGIVEIPFADEVWCLGDNLTKITLLSDNRLHLEHCRLPMADNKGVFTGSNTNDAIVDSQKRIWIASRFGVYLYPWGNEVQLLTPYFKDVIKLMPENDTTTWALSSSQGILRITEKKGHFLFGGYNLNNGKLKAREAKTILRDADGVIWVGTDNGLFTYNLEKDVFENRNAEYKLLDKNISNIQQDANQNLWLTSNGKIIKFDRAHKTSITYSSIDNIQVTTFRPNSSLLLGDTLMVFGGSEGLCYFRPIDEEERFKQQEIVFTDIQIFNKSIFDRNNFEYNICKNDSLVLSYKQNNIGIEFSSLDYNLKGNTKYAFKLDGVDADWVYVDSKRRYVNYNNLPEGEYLFHVKSSGVAGDWSGKAKTLHIRVTPAPYLTLTAYCFYVILCLFIVGISAYMIVNRIRLRNKLTISNIEKKKSEELTQTKLRYFTNVSHELLTPLTIISCLTDEIGLLHPEISSEYATMKANINRLKRLLQQVLDFRKTESANMKLKVGYGDLVKLIREICRLNFAPLVHEKEISFRLNISEEQLLGWFDQDKIDKIVFNLLSNAFKYTPKGGSIEVSVNSFSCEDIEWASIAVRDNGCGITEKFLPVIFNSFVSNTHDAKVEANGIGLSLAKDLIELHHGIIKVESQPNKGSLFTIEFPVSEEMYKNELKFDLAHSNEDTIITPDDNLNFLPQCAPDKEKQSILLVDDNVDLLGALSRFFSKRFGVYTATNGVEAIACLKECDVNLIVSDVMMPEMDGFELCAYVKKNIETSHIPVILLTAKTQVQDRIDCYKAEANAYIAKPFDLALLDVRIDNLLNARREKNKQYKKEIHINLQDLDYNSIDQEYLNKAIEIVELHLSDFDFTPEILIKEMATTKSTLYRKLKSLTGLSTSEFIKNIRLKRACEMLEKEVGNISDIAYNVGFNDPKYFSTCFRTELGMSPRDYVKSLKNEMVATD